jgi:hypothetical protein
VGLPLVYRRADLDLRYRISLVDMVMGELPPPLAASRRALGIAFGLLIAVLAGEIVQTRCRPAVPANK